MFVDDEELKNNEQVEEEEENLEGEEELEAGIVSGLTDVDTVGLVRESFLDYAMSVIVARAIPDARDGMKPVHRRIVYAMSEAGNTPDKPFKKCARIVGDVMGKYHPHGDAAIYGALVRLAQPFAMRYTLVEGHGNFGSIDGDEPAAYRYTEARMAKMALEMVRDINCDVVDFVDNYDGVDQEPSVLPSRFPNLLVNGSSGIAVGMATNMPPHNLNEVVDGIVALSKNPDITTEELMQYIKGPDFPTGAIILGRSGIRDAYETGNGSIAIRSKCHIEERGEHGSLKRIVVDEVPYGVNKALMIENIAGLARDKLIDGITDIRDESNKDGIRVVIEVRRDIIPEVLLNQLYKMTQLQSSFGIINLCLVDGAPKVCSLKTLLNQYLDFQVSVIERRTKFLLDKDKKRDHIVIGLIKCHDNIDDIVDIIKKSSTPEDASTQLMDKYGFSEEQVNAILAMTLRRLTGIETEKLEAERKMLEKNIEEYNRILSDRNNQVEVVINELNEIKEKFGDERRTELSNEAANIDDESLIPEEDIVITLSRGGYIKRLTPDSFRVQNRGGRGVKGAGLNDNDHVEMMVYAKTHTDILIFTDYGKVYKIRGYQIPEGQKGSKGIPVINLINIEKGENVKEIIAVNEYRDDRYLMFVTELGIIKKTHIKEYESIRQNGKIAIALNEGDMLLAVKQVSDYLEGVYDKDGNPVDVILGIAGSHGLMASFPVKIVNPIGRVAHGVKGITLPKGEKVIGVTVNYQGEYMLIMTDKGYGKLTEIQDKETGKYSYTVAKNRGGKGVLAFKSTPKNGKLVLVRAVHLEDDLLVITNAGIVIRTPLSQIRIVARHSIGVKIMNLEDRQKVASLTILPHEDVMDDGEDSQENIDPLEEENSQETNISENKDDKE